MVKSDSMRIIINEKQEKNIIKYLTKEFLINEAALDSFSLDELKSKRYFKDRLNYCRAHLGFPIGNGSSRVVFQIDDDKVLKLAKNAKGIAQNQEEENRYHNMFDYVLPRVYEASDDFSFIIAEYVLPSKEKDFKHITNLSFDEFRDFLCAVYNNYAYRDKRINWTYSDLRTNSDEFWDMVLENECLDAINDYLGNTNYDDIGDLLNLGNWGLANRDGHATLVILDNGLSAEIFNKFYNKTNR